MSAGVMAEIRSRLRDRRLRHGMLVITHRPARDGASADLRSRGGRATGLEQTCPELVELFVREGPR